MAATNKGSEVWMNLSEVLLDVLQVTGIGRCKLSATNVWLSSFHVDA